VHRTACLAFATQESAHIKCVEESPRRAHAWTEGRLGTDATDRPANRAVIVALALNADVLFIEAAFAQADAQLVAERAHLTTDAAGRLASAGCGGASRSTSHHVMADRKHA
jgi:hypothetical protein